MKHVFIVGCPRSGTSWLQLLLAQHPNVATTQETHLFNRYLRPVHRTWERFKSEQTTIGMQLILSDDEFDGLCADFARKVLQKIADTNPAATVVVEKTPNHVREAQLILRLLPDVYFVHLVRDPRSVVSSMRAAVGLRLTESWASRSIRANAMRWRADVIQGREISQLTGRYREVRYEDLRGNDGAQALQDLCAWIDLPVDREFAIGALNACQIDRLREGGAGVRGYDSLRRAKVFFRKGMLDGWRDDLSRHEIETVEYMTRDLMQTYGYPCAVVTEPSKKPIRLVVDDVVVRGKSWIRRRVDVASKKLLSVR